jgi:tetratricopeptide (TPR) repeat protein
MFLSVVRSVGWERRRLVFGLGLTLGLVLASSMGHVQAQNVVHPAPVSSEALNVGAAATHSASPASCQELTQTEIDGRSAPISNWQAALSACQKDPDFLAALGQILNRQTRYTEAVDHLERALLLDPNKKDAQLAYAIALAGAGDLLSAQGFLQDLLQDPQLPDELRQKIEQQEAAVLQRQQVVAQKSLSQNQWAKKLTLTARYGQDSNLLGSPDLASLNLTIGGQTLSLPLDQQYQAKKGAYIRADMQLEMVRGLQDGSRLELVASLRQRSSPSESLGNNTQTDVLLEQSKLSAGFYWQALASNLDAQTGVRYQVSGLGAGFSAEKIGKCLARWGFEGQERTYFNAQVLSGSYTGLAVTSVCDLGWQTQLLLSLKHGIDRAKDPARPGGDQQISSLRALIFMPLSWLGKDGLLLDLEQALQQDSHSYSSLLESGATRGLSRQAVRVEYQKEIARGFQSLVGLERFTQSSNLELFRADNSGAYISLRWVW